MGKKLLKILPVDFSNDNLEFKWYPVVTAINYERKVADSLKSRFESMGAGDKFGEVMVPIREWTEEVVSAKPKKDGTHSRRKVKKSENVFLTGYIFVKMVMDNSTWNIVRQTTGVAGWLKADGRPSPIEESEVIAIKERLKTEEEKTPTEFNGGIGDLIKIKSAGNMEATITDIDKDKGLIKAINSFGKKVECDITSVEIVS